MPSTDEWLSCCSKGPYCNKGGKDHEWYILCTKTNTIARLYKVKDKRLRWCTKGHVTLCTPPPTCDTHLWKRKAKIGTVAIWDSFVRERGNWQFGGWCILMPSNVQIVLDIWRHQSACGTTTSFRLEPFANCWKLQEKWCRGQTCCIIFWFSCGDWGRVSTIKLLTSLNICKWSVLHWDFVETNWIVRIRSSLESGYNLCVCPSS